MNYLLILLAVSMLVSGLGWIYFIYFFSIGYGFGVSALAVTIAILFKDVMTLPTALLCAVMFIFGCRLGLYLLTREKRSPEYKKILYGPDAAKKINKHRFVDTGVYRLVRCPNYLGELVIWTGSFIVCFGACCTIWQWIIAAIGYIGIVYVMFSGARRLEIRQNGAYGNDPEYQAYINKTPILLPFVPIYSVEKYKWLQA